MNAKDDTDGNGAEQSTLSPLQVAELALAIWRIDRRARRDSSTPEPVCIACETAIDKLREMTIELRDLTGESYDVKMKVRVVHHEAQDDQGALRIIECLSPAVYFQNKLIHPAEVVVGGGT